MARMASTQLVLLGKPVFQLSTATLPQPAVEQLVGADHRIDITIGQVVVNLERLAIITQHHAVVGIGHLLGMKVQRILISTTEEADPWAAYASEQ